MSSTEKATQRAILDYLALTGVFHWRNNTGSFKNKAGGFYRFGALGSPDIFAVLRPTGQLLGIEVKDVKGKLNPNQEAFRDQLEGAGGRYIVARSLDDVIPLFKRP
jgi:hypothetical protein